MTNVQPREAKSSPPVVPDIAVPAEMSSTYDEVLSAVSEMYGVRFVPYTRSVPATADGLILFDVSGPEVLSRAMTGVRTLAYVTGPAAGCPQSSGDICFGLGSYLPAAFRGSRLSDEGVTNVYELVPRPEDDIIARRAAQVLWLSRKEGATPLDLVSVPPPRLAKAEFLFSRWHDREWFALLPLLHFVREISGWTPPPPRACFMFDDPNLHWPSYGYVKYADMIEHADACNYHAAFATIPLDAWFAHQETARLFREYRNRVSLLIHGNDHEYRELFHARAPLPLAAQALRRIERLERTAGVQVSRVMAAPHGACSAATAEALLRTGFEAACISRSSLMARNRDVAWPVSMGLQQATIFGGGLPVIPRFNIHALSEQRARCAVFLGQPIITVGHHDDLHDGLGELERLARAVNKLGSVMWTDMTTIARSNYQTKKLDGVLHVRMFARRVEIEIPADVTHLDLHLEMNAGNSDGLVLRGGGEPDATGSKYAGDPLRVQSGDRVTIVAELTGQVDPHSIPGGRTRVRAIVRRQLCEGRDRLRPALARLFRTRSSAA